MWFWRRLRQLAAATHSGCSGEGWGHLFPCQWSLPRRRRPNEQSFKKPFTTPFAHRPQIAARTYEQGLFLVLSAMKLAASGGSHFIRSSLIKESWAPSSKSWQIGRGSLGLTHGHIGSLYWTFSTNKNSILLWVNAWICVIFTCSFDSIII